MTHETDKNVSDEMLMALADGELTGPDASKLLARIRANPDLAARYALFTETAAALREAMDPGAVPDHLIAAVLTAPTGLPAPEAGAARVVPLRRDGGAGRGRAVIWPMALAASLVLAVGVGGFLTGRSLAPVAAPQSGTLAASIGPEAAAVALAGVATGGSVMLEDGSTARALGSFDTDLGLCRLIGLEGADGHADRAVICLDAERRWRSALTVTEGQSGLFLPASDMAVEVIDAFLDGIGAGAALPPAAEAQRLAR
jgi:hypothetical protein